VQVARSFLHRADWLVVPDAAPGKGICQKLVHLIKIKEASTPLLDEDKDDVEEGESEDDRAADGVEPGVDWVQHLIERRAGEWRVGIGIIHF